MQCNLYINYIIVLSFIKLIIYMMVNSKFIILLFRFTLIIDSYYYNCIKSLYRVINYI